MLSQFLGQNLSYTLYPVIGEMLVGFSGFIVLALFTGVYTIYTIDKIFKYEVSTFAVVLYGSRECK